MMMVKVRVTMMLMMAMLIKTQDGPVHLVDDVCDADYGDDVGDDDGR